jgi:hypothetical protein
VLEGQAGRATDLPVGEPRRRELVHAPDDRGRLLVDDDRPALPDCPDWGWRGRPVDGVPPRRGGSEQEGGPRPDGPLGASARVSVS